MQFSYCNNFFFNFQKDVSKCPFVSELAHENKDGHFDKTVWTTKRDTDLAFDCSADLCSNVNPFDRDITNGVFPEKETRGSHGGGDKDENAVFVVEIAYMIMNLVAAQACTQRLLLLL